MNQSRKEWMRREGSARAVITGHAIINSLDFAWEPLKYDEFQYFPTDENFASRLEALGANGIGYVDTIIALAKQLRVSTGYEHMLRSAHRSNDANAFQYQDGLQDQEFTWHFGGCIAMHTAHSFVRDGLITKDALRSATLSDWADIIDSHWFSDLMHDMAVTANSVYQQFGMNQNFYLDSASTPPFIAFDTNIVRQDADDLPPELQAKALSGPSAKLTITARHELRHFLKATNDASITNETQSSVGCPVARKKFEVSHDADIVGAHRLAHNGLVSISASRAPDRQTVTQAITPIDRYLTLLADTLCDIDQAIGTPVVGLDGTATYQKLPKTNAFVWES